MDIGVTYIQQSRPGSKIELEIMHRIANSKATIKAGKKTAKPSA
jgi:hypothetical protein